MIEEAVRVVEQDGYYVWVETISNSTCNSCGSQSRCGTSVLSSLFKQRRNRLRVINGLNLQTGEQAILGMNEQDLVKAAFYVYMLPVLLMVVIGLVANAYGLGDNTVILLCMLGLVADFLLVRVIGKHPPGGLVMVRLLRRSQDPGEQDSIQFINLERDLS